MNLKSGARLGPYEILAPLGAGGMGEVYRARDPRLGRTVAIKVLPAEFSADAKLRLRFEREARAISSLNHPHICSVYDIGHEDGRDYLVMEYIEGETLWQRLARGPLPTEQVLRYGIEIADGLDKAHRQGIIHRDLKPSNIMIAKSGAKLLDFGLAKSRHASIWDQARSKASLLPTAEKPLTAEGSLVGTLEYMAPEQLEGKEADARTDIFALGGVLYRMATGKRPFEGDSDASLIAAILEREPRPITELQPLAPAALDRVVRSCLTKDPDERIQTAHDVLLQLRWIAEEISHPSLETRPISQRRSRLLPWLALAIGVTVAVAAALITWQGTMRDNEPFRPQRFELQPPERVRVAESTAPSILAISPNGVWVAFRGVSDEPNRTGLYLRSTREIGARLVPGSVDGPFFSPDSKWLGFFGEGFLQKVPVSGGEPRRICQVPRVRGASWGDDGMILFSTGEALLRVSAEGGQPDTLTKPPPGERHYWPHFLPGSKHALFVVHSGFSDSWRKVAALSLEDRKIRTLATGTSPRYVDGQLVYSHLGTLHSTRFDPETLKLSGEPRAILDDVYFYGGSGFTAFDVSRSGSLVYVPGAERLRDSELIWVDREGHITPAVEESRNYVSAAVSPDGKQFAVVIRTTLEDSDLWIYETERRHWTRLTNGKRVSGDELVWSPDNQWIVFSSAESGHGDLFRIAADGSKAPERLTSGVEWEYPGGISARDNVLVFMRQVQAAQWDLLTLPLEGSGTPQPFLATPVLEAWPAFSPDGRRVAYESEETGTREIHVRPYPGPGQKVTISSGGGWRKPLWSRDGRELFYQRGNEIWAAPVSAGGVFTAGQPKRLFTADFLRGAWEDSVDVASDGKFLIVRHPPELRPQRRLVYVPNWTAELKQIHAQSQ